MRKDFHRSVLEAFCIQNGEVEFFDFGQEPIVRESFGIGKEEAKEAGFYITNDCIHCGVCEKVCPQKCIKEYKIDQTHCLHCGLCQEKCQIGAVKRKTENEESAICQKKN